MPNNGFNLVDFHMWVALGACQLQERMLHCSKERSSKQRLGADSTDTRPDLLLNQASVDTATPTWVCTSYACDPILLPRQYLRPPGSCCLCPGLGRFIHACPMPTRAVRTKCASQPGTLAQSLAVRKQTLPVVSRCNI
jgi:hypothetical protein